MARLEDLTRGAAVQGVLPDCAVTVIDVTCYRAVVEVGGGPARASYLRRPFQREPDFAVEGISYNLSDLLARAEAPRCPCRVSRFARKP